MRQACRKSLLFSVVAAVMLFAGGAEAQNFATGNIAGTVIFNGAAVGGNSTIGPFIQIAGTNTYVESDTNGAYAFSTLQPGSYNLRVYANYFFQASGLIASFPVTVTAGNTTALNLDLTPYAGAVTGTLSVNGVAQQLNVKTTTLNDVAFSTNAAGLFKRFYPPGTDVGQVSTNAGSIVGTFPFTITVGQTTTVNSNFQTGNISGSIIFNGAAVSGQNGTVIGPFIQIAGTNTYTESDAAGAYSFTNLAPGNYSLGVYSNYFFQASGLINTFAVTVTGGSTTTANLDITSSAGAVAGTITVNGVGQQVNLKTTTLNDVAFSTNATGAFKRFYPPGTDTGQVSANSGSIVGTFPFTISAGQVVTINPNFQTGNVSGKVTFNGAAAGGSGVIGPFIQIVGTNTYTESDSTGAYSFANLAPGSYALGVYSNYFFQASGLIANFPVTVTGGNTATANLEIAPYSGEIVGAITVNNVAQQVNVKVTTINDVAFSTTGGGAFSRFYPAGASTAYTGQVSSNQGSIIGTFGFTLTAGAISSADQGTVAAGTNVAISGNGGAGAVNGITVTFSNVSASGSETITSGASGAAPPAGYTVVGPRYYTTTTGATYSGTLQVCIQYDPALVTSAQTALKLTDATNSFAQLTNQTINTTTHVICGTTTTVSTWAILQPIPPVLTPSSATIEANGKLTFVASSGGGAPYVFSLTGSGSINPSTGVYTAGGTAGATATITVTDSLSRTATAAVTVGPALAISPASVTLLSGATQQFTASNGASYIWSVNSGASGTISAAGLYTAGVKAGIDTITLTDAAGASVTAQATISSPLSLSPATVTVIPRGTQQFTPSSGAADATYTWSIAPSSGAGTISSTGFYTAGATAGATATITVNSNGSTATAAVTVGAGVTVSPTASSVAPRATRQFSAIGGSGAPYSWTLGSSPNGAIEVNTGLYTAGAAAGSDTVTATDSFGNVGSTTIATTAAISITQGNLSLAPLSTQTFTATGGNGGPFTWTVNSGASGSITSGGAYTAGTVAGVDSVTATDSLHNTASVNVTVTAPLSISPTKQLIPPLGTQQFTATGGTGPMNGYTFSVVGAGSINSVGLYTAPSLSGNIDTVSVTDQNRVTASTTITTGAGISITPAGAVVPPRGTQQFSASGGAGAPFTWSTSGVGSINSSGLYSAPSTPSVADSVTAADSLGNSLTVNLTIGAGISVTNASLAVAPLGSLQLKAFGGSGTGYAWALAQPASGTITAAGLYSPGATPNVTDSATVTDSLGNSFTTTIFVTGPLVLDTTSVTLPPRGSHQFSASGGSNAGYKWDAIAPVDGSIDSTGLFTAGGIGNQAVQIVASDSNHNTVYATIYIGPAVSIDPTNVNIAPLGTFHFTAAGGNGQFIWSLFAPAHGSISQTGVYTATSTGTFSDTVAVTDTLGNSASAAIFSTDALAISPGSATVPPHGKLQFSAVGGTGTGLAWSLQSGASGTITALGLYTAAGVGAKADTVKLVDNLGNSATATISVGPGVSITPLTATVAPRGSQQFAATGGSGNGYFWSLQVNAAGTISSGGLYRAGAVSAVDTVTVIDTLGNSASTTVTTSSVLAITPGSATLAPNATQQFTTTGGAGSTVGWRVIGAGTISVTGLYHAFSAPNVSDTIIANDTLGNTASATVTIGVGVSITPANASVAPRGTQQFSASGGSNTGFSYSVQGNGSITPTGLYTASSLGGFDTVTVTDSVGNTASAKVTVTSTLKISPSSAALVSGGTAQFSASGGSGAGLTWSVTGNDGGTITQAGLYTAGAGTGTDTVTVVDSNGNSTSVTVVVTGATTGGSDGGTGNTSSGSSGCATTNSNSVAPLFALGLAFLILRRRKVPAKV